MSPDRQREANPYPRDEEAPVWGPSGASSLGWRVQELERRIALLEGEVSSGRDTLVRLEERLGQAIDDIRQMRRDMGGIKRAFYALGSGLMLAMAAAVFDLATRV